MDLKYVICRKEINGETVVCRQYKEEPDLFKLIAQCERYIIYENGIDITEKYKQHERN